MISAATFTLQGHFFNLIWNLPCKIMYIFASLSERQNDYKHHGSFEVILHLSVVLLHLCGVVFPLCCHLASFGSQLHLFMFVLCLVVVFFVSHCNSFACLRLFCTFCKVILLLCS